jgi:hypothetical protein
VDFEKSLSEADFRTEVRYGPGANATLHQHSDTSTASPFGPTLAAVR